MDSGLYAACAGLSAKTRALDVVANSLANLNPAGYRSHETTFQALGPGGPRAAANALNAAVNDFGVLGGSRVDLSPANLQPTGNPLDLAPPPRGRCRPKQPLDPVSWNAGGSEESTDDGQHPHQVDRLA